VLHALKNAWAVDSSGALHRILVTLLDVASTKNEQEREVATEAVSMVLGTFRLAASLVCAEDATELLQLVQVQFHTHSWPILARRVVTTL
jgi:hypothetical protein